MNNNKDKQPEGTPAKNNTPKDGNKRLKKVFSELQASLDYLRVHIKYLLFDKEASHRESEVIKKDLRAKRGELAILKSLLRTVRKSLDSVRKSLREAKRRNTDLVMENWRLRKRLGEA